MVQVTLRLTHCRTGDEALERSFISRIAVKANVILLVQGGLCRNCGEGQRINQELKHLGAKLAFVLCMLPHTPTLKMHLPGSINSIRAPA